MQPEIAIPAAIPAKPKLNTRRTRVWTVRILAVVVWLGSWELAASHWIDPFFYSKPSAIWGRLVDWFTKGTAFGSVWQNIAVTLQEAVLGFAIGALAGVI